jgi:hypothetical protein
LRRGLSGSEAQWRAYVRIRGPKPAARAIGPGESAAHRPCSAGIYGTLTNVINKVCRSDSCRGSGRDRSRSCDGSPCFSSNAVLGVGSISLWAELCGIARKTCSGGGRPARCGLITLRLHAIDAYTRSASTGNERPGLLRRVSHYPVGPSSPQPPLLPGFAQYGKSRRSAVCAFIRFTSELSPNPAGFGRRLHIKPAVGDNSIPGFGDPIAGMPALNVS